MLHRFLDIGIQARQLIEDRVSNKRTRTHIRLSLHLDILNCIPFLPRRVARADPVRRFVVKKQEL